MAVFLQTSFTCLLDSCSFLNVPFWDTTNDNRCSHHFKNNVNNKLMMINLAKKKFDKESVDSFFLFLGVFSICCPPIWCWGCQHTDEGSTRTVRRLLLRLLAALSLHTQPALGEFREVATVCQLHCSHRGGPQKVLWLSRTQGQTVLLPKCFRGCRYGFN